MIGQLHRSYARQNSWIQAKQLLLHVLHLFLLVDWHRALFLQRSPACTSLSRHRPCQLSNIILRLYLFCYPLLYQPLQSVLLHRCSIHAWHCSSRLLQTRRLLISTECSIWSRFWIYLLSRFYRRVVCYTSLRVCNFCSWLWLFRIVLICFLLRICICNKVVLFKFILFVLYPRIWVCNFGTCCLRPHSSSVSFFFILFLFVMFILS